jgi:shikimate dehydrogenase
MRRSDPDWLGCNVTIPHKIAVMDYVDDPGGVRERIGAVNTIASETGGPLIGTNTDAGGFLQPLLRDKWKGQSAVIVGTGGAARAILFALTSLGVPDITIMARDVAKAQALFDHGGTPGRTIAMGERLPAADLLVNATSLGMVGQPLLDLDVTPLADGATVYDIVYAPLETGLLKAAKARGLRTLDGLEMLIGQAALAFDIFFDAQAPRDLDEELRALLLSADV